MKPAKQKANQMRVIYIYHLLAALVSPVIYIHISIHILMYIGISVYMYMSEFIHLQSLTKALCCPPLEINIKIFKIRNTY